MMIKVVGISFFNSNRIYYFSPGMINVREGNYVIVETERGLQIAKAVTNILEKQETSVFLPLKEIIRIATTDDFKINEKNIKDAKKALAYAKKLVESEKINMKFFEAGYTLDRKKLIFKFIADERVDFREIVKILAAKYKTRIELRQIGVRDKAKEIGGIGPCGRLLCCGEFLTNFESVSINMAKNQAIALNPTKINGSCGRLLCCLGYEDEVYTEYKKQLPKVGEFIETNGVSGRVSEVDVLNKKYKLKISENEEVTVEA